MVHADGVLVSALCSLFCPAMRRYGGAGKPASISHGRFDFDVDDSQEAGDDGDDEDDSENGDDGDVESDDKEDEGSDRIGVNAVAAVGAQRVQKTTACLKCV